MKWLVLAAISLSFLSSAHGASTTKPATYAAVDEAIKKASDYLFSKQKNGHWDSHDKRDPTTRPSTLYGGQFGGETALITYALLAADQSPQDPRMVSAINWLRNADMIGTYAVAMRAQVWNNLPKTPENKQAIQKDAKILLDLWKKEGSARGFYDYLNLTDKLNKSDYDHSASQFGVLGAWACAENIPEFPPNYWAIVDKAWRDDQLPDGAWCYKSKPQTNSGPSLSMTTAGVATLFITQDFLSRGLPAVCNGNIKDEALDKGLNWIEKNFQTVFGDRSQVRDAYYTLFGVERVGFASGYKYFNNLNWYQSGASFLISKQTKSAGNIGTPIDTALSLLFLSRGRSPITVNKLQYDIKDKEANWNERPRDIANLSKYIARQAERELQWQIVTLRAPLEELHDAPLLYIAGNQELILPDEQKNKLRQYVEEGGVILAQADGGSLKFAKSVRALGADLFPQYEFRALGADHPIYTQELFPATKFKKRPNLLGISNGARELMILLPDDPARSWQPMDLAKHSDDFQIGADIFLYAIDKKNLVKKGQTYLVSADPEIKTTSSISVARLQYDGKWDPEPGGWRRLSAIMRNAHHIDLKTETIELGEGKLKDQKFAHLTGTTQFKLEDDARKELKDFVTNGGTLIVDAAGGTSAFAQSAEAELEATFGDDAKQLSEPLPADNPLYLTGKTPIEIVWRTFARRQIGAIKGGRLRAIKIKNRPAVIYSPEDLSVGLVGQPVDGIDGYEPKTATALMANILMVASKSK